MYFAIPLFVFVLIASILMVIVHLSQGRRFASLWVILAGVRNGIPLAELLDAHGRELGGIQGRRIIGFAEQLRQGSSLSEISTKMKAVLPPSGRLAVLVGEETGTIGDCLESTVQTLDRKQNPDRYAVDNVVLYTITVLVVVVLIISFLMYFVVPKYKIIFEGFGIELGSEMQWLIWSSDFVLALSVLLSTFVAVIVIVFCCLTLLKFTEIAVTAKHYSNLSVTESLQKMIMALTFPLRMVWRFLISFYPSRARGEIYRFLAVHAKTEQPLIGMLESLSRHFPAADIRRRLNRVCRETATGEDLWSSLNRVGIVPRRDLGIIRAAASANQLPYMLNELSIGQQFAQQGRTLSGWEVARCLFIVALFVPVGLIAAAFFMPLIKLMMMIG